MFTGIIEAIGRVVQSDGKRLWLETPFRKLKKGESVAVDGVCLTVSAFKGAKQAAFDVGPETRRLTTLARRRSGDPVNLERSLQIGARLGGHWVSGHVEGQAKITAVKRTGASSWYTLQLPAVLMKHVVLKGSLAVDGISLTVARRRGRQVDLMIVPHTRSHTALGRKKVGDSVNIETDLLAKYALLKHS